MGAGQSAAQFIEAARGAGHVGRLTLIGDELPLPYQRPPLSKEYLAGARSADWLSYREPHFYSRHDVATHLGRRVAAIDRARQQVQLDDGTAVEYDALCLATGTRVRRLPETVVAAGDVHYLRTIADADVLRAQLPSARRVVIVGGGFIGLEVAAVLSRLGHEVVVLEVAPRLLPRVAAPELSAFLYRQHAAHGVRIVCGASVVSIQRQRHPDKSDALLVKTANGDDWPADMVIAGIGILPNEELAAAAKLVCDDGIVVDETACTSDPNIVAAGDCTRHPNDIVGRALRLETVHNAVEQAKVAAQTLCGRVSRYAQTPWVWSDQFGFRLHVVGQIDGYDSHVIRGDPDHGKFAVCYFRQGRFIALHAVNRPAEFAAARRLLNARAELTPEQAADTDFNLAGAAQPARRLEFARPWPTRKRSAAILAERPS